MLAAAGRAGTLLGDSATAVGDSLLARLLDEGGFADRSGAADLYYTVFGLQALTALAAELPAGKVAGYLASFGTGDGLDMLHLCCLTRCWALLGSPAAGPELRDAVLRRLEACRCHDGGYALRPGLPAGSAYGCFLALGAHEDLGAELPDPPGLGRCLQSLRTPDGAYANDAHLPVGSTPATAAAVTALCRLRLPPPPETADWLLARHCPAGGFLAVAPAPHPDLLSTATALHALRLLDVDLADVREPCLRFVRSLRRGDGSFAGHADDPTGDCEYTFYALLALGHLAG
jgi:prenyltransferase beta subunit